MLDIHEKISLRGCKSLSELELLTVLLEDEALSERVLKECVSLANIATMSPSRLRMVAGLGNKRAERILSAVEIGWRVVRANRAVEDTIGSSEDVVNIMRPMLKDLQHEECWALYLTNANRILERQMVSQGGVQATVVDNRIILRKAVELSATRIILVHNHPSGSAAPSGADFEITKRLKEAAATLDIQLLDHIIISATESFSFKSSGKL